ncbi:MAG: 50S ribosomal protein L13 [delta proteobacterium ML8_F1]|nr:MAG: 50S ribosomal protein L13 [delta proteobacterium ML8_F1]
MKSYVAKPLEIERKWYVVDATDKTLGRLSTQIATILRGKHKPIYTPHVDTGDFVIVINAEKVKVTGNKASDKMYRWHTGYLGHMRERNYNEMMAKKPEEIIRLAVKGMMPKNSLGRQMFTKLKVYAGPEHKHSAQQPEALEL